jgi:hypothetical protein
MTRHRPAAGTLLGALVLSAFATAMRGTAIDRLPAAAFPQVGGQDVVWRDEVAAGAWRALPAAGVQLEARVERDATGLSALRLDFDFQGRGGWAAVRRPVDLALPDNWEFRFQVRGSAPTNHLEVKFVDEAGSGSGENVWWSVRRDLEVPAEWTTLRVKKRQVSFAWGPAGGGDVRRVRAIEIAITAGSGGRGTLWVTDMELVAQPPRRPYTGTPVAAATSDTAGGTARLALDGRRDTAWRPARLPAALEVDFGAPRELGGLTLHWTPGGSPLRLAVDVAEEPGAWREVRRVEHGGGPRSDLLLPDTDARALRITVLEEPAANPTAAPHAPAPALGGTRAGLAEIVVRPLAFGATPTAMFEARAAESPRGRYPRGMSGEQVFWTLAGVDGDANEALVSEDGAVEFETGGPTVEPFVYQDGHLLSWSDVETSQRLVDGDLPIPVVTWSALGLQLEITALATGKAGDSTLHVRYDLRNTGTTVRRGRLFLAARPFQVNPPAQFLNRPGGAATIRRIACEPGGLVIDARRVAFAPAPESCGTAAFDQGCITDSLARGEVPVPLAADDGAVPYGSGAAGWRFDLAPGAGLTVLLGTPLETVSRAERQAGPEVSERGFADALAHERRGWRALLDRVRIDLPDDAAALARIVRSSLAWVLVNRDGPAIQPGSRAYARSWIRDGTLTSTALLRLRHEAVARDFAAWFAGFQYPDGRIPCCVDERGADPVPEHDAHGQFIHLVAEIARFTGDRAFAARHYPHVRRAAAAIDALRAERRVPAYRTPQRQSFFGLLPESISHEGYSARPVHSYWDSGFAWRGLADAAWLASWLGHAGDARRFATSHDELGADLRASIARVREDRGLEYVPGSADLGDFDSTATTVMLDPVGLDALVPGEAIEATFARFDREVRARFDGRTAWDAYTPYEVRHVGAYVRIGWRDRAHDLLTAYLADRRPPGWNQLPEVMTREMRRPRFLGDLPHGWVASDLVRSVLDLFAYVRPADDSLVVGAGVPASWVRAGKRVGIEGLGTPYGPLSWSASVVDGRLEARLAAIDRPPAGGVRLALPWPAGTRVAEVDGRPVPIAPDGTLLVGQLPACVLVHAAW